MLAKKEGLYSEVNLMPDGTVVRFSACTNIFHALSEVGISCIYSSIQFLKNCNWELCEPSLETLSVGDYIEDNIGKRRIMMAQGVGEFRTYCLSLPDDFNESYLFFTAHELKEEGFTPLPWEDDEIEIKISRESTQALGLI